MVSPCHCEHSEANRVIGEKEFEIFYINLTVCFATLAMTGAYKMTGLTINISYTFISPTISSGFTHWSNSSAVT